MTTYKVLVLLGIPLALAKAALPLKLAIDCGSQETALPSVFKQNEFLPRRDIENLCSIIHNAVPKSVQDAKFILIGDPNDQSISSNDFRPIAVPPSKGFVPKFKVPRLKVPKFDVPILKSAGPSLAPKVGASMNFPLRPRVPVLKSAGPSLAPRVAASMNFPLRPRALFNEESSAERMEKFKKGIQKMLHVVKVMGQIDQYVSERTRIIVDILSKTFSEPNS